MNLRKKIIGELEKYADAKGRVDCVKSMAISKRLNVNPLFVGRIASEEGYRISNCELGQFGDKRIERPDIDVNRALMRYAKEGKVRCKDCWSVALRFGMVKVRSSIKNGSFEVIDCQLGCFSRKIRPRLKVEVSINIINKTLSNKFKLCEYEFDIIRYLAKVGSFERTSERFNVSLEDIKRIIGNIEKSFKVECFDYGNGILKIKKDCVSILDKVEELNCDVKNFAKRRLVELFYSDRKYKNIKAYYEE